MGATITSDPEQLFLLARASSPPRSGPVLRCVAPGRLVVRLAKPDRPSLGATLYGAGRRNGTVRRLERLVQAERNGPRPSVTGWRGAAASLRSPTALPIAPYRRVYCQPKVSMKSNSPNTSSVPSAWLPSVIVPGSTGLPRLADQFPHEPLAAVCRKA